MSDANRAAGQVLLGEEAEISTQWHANRRVRLHRRVVSEVVTVEVTLRREELVVEEFALQADSSEVTRVAGPPVRDPVTIVLRREVPDVRARIEPYERLTISTDVVQEQVAVDLTLRRESVTAHVGDA